jgi:hypothetical protein
MATGVRIDVGQAQSKAKHLRFLNQGSDSYSETMRLIVKGAETETQAKYRQRYVRSRKRVDKVVEERKGEYFIKHQLATWEGNWRYLPSTHT